MPAYRIPRRTGAHRVGAIALYRALLSQCRRLPCTTSQCDELQNIVRHRFRQACHEQSARRLKFAFEACYEAIDHIDGAVAGNDESRSHILKLLGAAPPKLKLPLQAEPQRVKREARSSSSDGSDRGEHSEPKLSIFDRPLPLEQLSGRRHVPYLINANHIPMLRIKKPQPQHLSGYLAHRINQRQARHDRKDRLNEELVLAGMEDEWDNIVAGHTRQGLKEALVPEPGWTEAIEMSVDEVQGQLHDEKRKNRIMAQKMLAVVDREAALARKEEAAWRDYSESTGSTGFPLDQGSKRKFDAK